MNNQLGPPEHIEDAIFEESLPSNSIPVINRLKELMEEAGTNNIKEAARDPRVRRCMWLLNAQYHSPTGWFDLEEQWKILKEQKQRGKYYERSNI